MSTDLKAYISQSPEPERKYDLEAHQEKMWHGVSMQELVDPPLFQPMHLGEAVARLNEMGDVLKDARNNVSAALDRIRNEHYVPAPEKVVKLPDSFIDELAQRQGLGGDFNLKDLKFGVQEITSKEQLARLQKDMGLISGQYKDTFGDIQLDVINQDGKQLAIVSGSRKMDVALLNSVRNLEVKHQKLAETVEAALGPSKQLQVEKPVTNGLAADMSEKIKALETLYTKKPQQPEVASADPKPLQTPAKEKASGVREVA